MISAIIITKNEEKHIAQCIESLSFCNEIIVVDSGSTDHTRDIATSLRATVMNEYWQGYGNHKNIGIEHAQYDWLLFLDADERISPELQEEILRITKMPKYPVYWIAIEDIFLGKSLKHLTGHNPRLVKKGDARWNESPIHEQLVYTDTKAIVHYKDSQSGEITSPIIHHSHQTVSSYVQKMHRYTSLDAEHMRQTGAHRSGREIRNSWLLPYKLGIRQLGKLLFYKKGILDGWQGIVWCMLSAYYEFEMAKKFRAL